MHSKVNLEARLSGMHCVESCRFSNVSTGISVAIFRVNVFEIGSPYTELIVDAESDLYKKT
jgi:hypothetical protein